MFLIDELIKSNNSFSLKSVDILESFCQYSVFEDTTAAGRFCSQKHLISNLLQ